MEENHYLITGGAGFIGRHVARELLSHGCRVWVLDALVEQVHGADAHPRDIPDGIEFIHADVRDPEAVRRALDGVTGVFHLAAEVGVGQSMYEIDRYTSVNDLGTAVLFQELIRRPVRRGALPLYGTVDEDRYKPTAGARKLWSLGYIGTYSDDRQPALQKLLLDCAVGRRHEAFVVAGPQYPETIRWPANVTRHDHLPPAAHPAFYASQSFTLNVTRAEMVAAGWSPSVRLFEAAACGTPIISDRWAGLEAFFPPGEAIIVADDTDDVVAALDLPDQTRRRIAAAARQIVLDRHSSRVRAAELERILFDCCMEGESCLASKSTPSSTGWARGPTISTCPTGGRPHPTTSSETFRGTSGAS